MSNILNWSLRGFQAALAVTNLGLASYVANYFNTNTRRLSPSSINFLIFAQIFSLLAIAYLEVAPRKLPKAAHPFASLFVEGTNALFYFAGMIAWAVFLSRLSFCNGTICGVARAAAVVAAVEFVAWVATTAMLAKELFKGGLRGSGTLPAPMREV
ncbi:hypothetical protein S7711_03146 [Stachybotrys chartarum IBT 7711]|uniref:MARVEL domain-containing protein n=1 Tax=Stachybotrys chartarum (strain CBS 109288 / IBT 7711) TaxID=1280523 RepID=A0A084AWI3_STACB|nr:hypothetical protein S7711_03146 [Stachybotrys chartarum IBT 7711]KFA49341.1 hypothetical protein S40293_04199 [Stachybotrys chartarum IBT 40293]KFA80491.1 hypothetical protein S40288_02096 [Stachybotrys chartarum IBT 40288]